MAKAPAMVKSWFDRVEDFLDELLAAGPAYRKLQGALRFLILVWRGSVANRCPVRAAALSYTTLLALVPLLAVDVPTLENGGVKMRGDGGMDVIWKLRPNVKWHDGVPFTSADVRFTVEAINGVSTLSSADLGAFLRNEADRQVLLRVSACGVCRTKRSW